VIVNIPSKSIWWKHIYSLWQWQCFHWATVSNLQRTPWLRHQVFDMFPASNFHSETRKFSREKSRELPKIGRNSFSRLRLAERLLHDFYSHLSNFFRQMDNRPASEKINLAIGVLVGVSLPFIVGLIYLYSSK